MNLTPELIAAYKKIMSNPKKHKMNFPSLEEIFEDSEESIAKHLVFNKYIEIVKVPNVISKLVFYIIMDKMFKTKIAADGNLGYCLKFKIEK